MGVSLRVLFQQTRHTPKVIIYEFLRHTFIMLHILLYFTPLRPLSAVIMLRKFISVFYYVVCVVGLGWQQYLMLYAYLQYNVTTTTTINFPHIIQPVSISFCVDFLSVINPQLFDLYPDIRRVQSAAMMLSRIHNEVPVDVILRFTPDLKEYFFKGGYKNSTSTYDTFHIKQFDTNIKVMKYLLREFVCYQYIVTRMKPMSYWDAVANFKSGSSLHYLTFNQLLQNITIVQITIGAVNRLPYRGVTTNECTRHKIDNSTSFIYSNHNFRINTHSLPSPFVTACYDYISEGFGDAVECIHNCVIKASVKKFNKVPLTSPIKSSTSKFNLLTETDLLNSTTFKEFQLIHDKCSNITCRHEACLESRIITNTNSGHDDTLSYGGGVGGHIVCEFVLPLFPDYNIHVTPYQTPLDIFVYILSSISTWTGVSILALNPLNLFTRLKVSQGDTVVGSSSLNHNVNAISNKSVNILQKRMSHLECVIIGQGRKLSSQNRKLRNLQSVNQMIVTLLSDVVKQN